MTRALSQTSLQPIPLWRAMGRVPQERAALGGVIRVDLAIVGGGFTGLSTALHAAEQGLSVAVLEAHSLAWGASGRNAGFVVPNFAKMDPDRVLTCLGTERGEALLGFAAGSADLVFDLIRRHRIECQAHQGGWVQPAHSRRALRRVTAAAEQWARRGRPVAILDRQAVLEMVGVAGYHGGWIDRSGGTLNPVAYAHGLGLAAEAMGARLFERSAVTAITREQDGWRLETAQGRVHAAKTILATNAYGGALDRRLARSYIPLKVFQIATEPLPAAIRARLLPHGQCVSDTRRNLFTFRFDSMNRLISGGMHVFGPNADARLPQTIHRRLTRLLGVKDMPQIACQWSGIAAITPDFLPHLAALGPDMIAPLACNGRGIALCTMMGKVLSEWAAGRLAETLPIPIAPPSPIFCHGLMRHAPNLLLPWSMLRDGLDGVLQR